jgi:LPXTG-motif cell wall-anchored protein
MFKRSLWLAVFAALLVLSGFARPAAAAEMAQVRVVHASPDAPAVDVYVDGTKALSNVAFFTASDYLSVPAGEHRFQVTPAGAASDKAVIDAKATLAAGQAYTVAAVGTLANIKPAILQDNLAAPAAGKAHIRVVHASPDAPAVDVKVKGGPTLISALAFPNASAYLPVDAGTYDLVVSPAGSSAVALDLSGTTLEAGKIYDVFAVGLLNGTPKLSVQITTPPPMTAGAPMPTGMPSTGAESLPALMALGVIAALLLGASGFVLQRQAR